MSRKPISTSPPESAANAAAAFADGHVDPVDPVAPVAPVAPLAAVDPLQAIREEERASLTEDLLATGAAPAYILLVCAKPGFRRGGFEHPARAEYPLDAFTAEQLDAFAAEPRIEMVSVGGTPIPRGSRLFGADTRPALPRDPRLAGDAAAAAVSDPPNRAAPGLRNAAAPRF